ncbi:uncharacterized protein LOC127007834 [Eriocheir sinensis]|uniref:uncharacterized protein LOC127007834 n=1 Tax=Eriocheir sinensis TaxID=95602 RepID=UPI0021C8C239|nr:uncharacterized protein LOC127007834 [Eriocheir sinensis]
MRWLMVVSGVVVIVVMAVVVVMSQDTTDGMLSCDEGDETCQPLARIRHYYHREDDHHHGEGEHTATTTTTTTTPGPGTDTDHDTTLDPQPELETTFDPDHHETTFDPDHHETTFDPDHHETTFDPDHHETTFDPDHHETTFEPDHHETTFDPDHHETTFDPDHHETTFDPDHHETTFDPDHHETTFDPDHHETTEEADDETYPTLPPDDETTPSPDNSLARQGRRKSRVPPAVGAEKYPPRFAGPTARRPKNPRPPGLPANILWQVVFTVKKARYTKAITNDLRLTFSEMLFNVGDAYLKRGVFFCPSDAGYFFSFHATARKGYGFNLELRLNRQYVVGSLVSNGTMERGSNSVFLELDRNDLISLHLRKGGAIQEGADAYTTFTGFIFSLRRRNEV